MILKQKLDIEDYFIYTKESINLNRIYKLISFVGYGMFGLLFLKYWQNNFIFRDEMISLVFIATCVINVNRITYFRERSKLKKASYLQDLLEEHTIELLDDKMIFKKGDDIYEIERDKISTLAETKHFFIIELNEISKFPIAKYKFEPTIINNLRLYFSHSLAV
jgi:hypothetical protein